MAEMRQPMLIDGEWVGAHDRRPARDPQNAGQSRSFRAPAERTSTAAFRLARVATRSSEPASQEDGDQGGDATGDLAG